MGSPTRACASRPATLRRPAALRRSGALALAIALAAAPASAQDGTSAEELFQLGKAAMARNELTKACSYFQGSLNADFALGTLLNLGICLEQSGKVASAWTAFRTLEDKARQATPPQAERARYAHDRAEALRPRLSRMRLVIAPATQALSGLTVKIDGVVAQPELFDVGVPVDTGKRSLVVSAPGYLEWSQTVVVDDEKLRLEVSVPALKIAPPPPPARPAPPPPDTSRRTTGFVVAGIGAASLVTGGVFGLLALRASNAAQCDGCVDPSEALTDAKSAYNRANTFGWVSNITIGAGVAALGLGTFLIFTSGPRSPRKTAHLYVSPAGLGLGGTL